MSTEEIRYEDDAPPEEAASNRNFLIILAVLGGIGVLTLLAIVGFAFFVLPNQRAARETQIAERNATNVAIQATNAQIAAVGTNASINAQSTSDAAATQAALPTNTPSAVPTAVPSNTPIPPTATVAPPSPTEGTPSGGQGGGATITPGGPTLTPTRVGGGSGGPNTATAIAQAVTATPLVGSLTRTPTRAAPTALPNTGFAEDAGDVLGLIGLALGLLGVVLIVRQVRMRLR
ncbi:MAG: hypothetical protein ACT4QE_06865 [Anaerolineales bacterium]